MTKLSNIKRLYLVELISQTVAIYTLYAVMFTDRSAMTPFQVGALFAAFSLTTILAEIPSGALADRFSRKWSIVLSKFVLVAALMIWLVAPGFTGYLIGMILFGVYEAMTSGAIQAYLYEMLGDSHKDFTHYNSRLWSIIMFGWVLGAVLAIIIGPNYNLLLGLSALMPAIGGLLAMGLARDGRDDNEIAVPILHNTRAAARYMFSSKVLILATLSILSLKILVDVMIEYIPLYYRDAGLSVRQIAIIMMIGNTITTLLFFFSNQIAERVKNIELASFFVLFCIMAMTSQLGTWPSVFGVFWFLRLARILFIRREGEFQHLLQNRHRATVTSMYSMASRLLTALSFLLIGFFAKDGIIVPILVFAGLFLIIYTEFRQKSADLDNAPKN